MAIAKSVSHNTGNNTPSDPYANPFCSPANPMSFICDAWTAITSQMRLQHVDVSKIKDSDIRSACAGKGLLAGLCEAEIRLGIQETKQTQAANPTTPAGKKTVKTVAHVAGQAASQAGQVVHASLDVSGSDVGNAAKGAVKGAGQAIGTAIGNAAQAAGSAVGDAVQGAGTAGISDIINRWGWLVIVALLILVMVKARR